MTMLLQPCLLAVCVRLQCLISPPTSIPYVIHYWAEFRQQTTNSCTVKHGHLREFARIVDFRVVIFSQLHVHWLLHGMASMLA
jgi:hypothetical protein